MIFKVLAWTWAAAGIVLGLVAALLAAGLLAYLAGGMGPRRR